MARALFAAIVVLACVGASLAVTDFCEADCVKEIYANNCGGAVCVAGVSTDEERDGLCSEQCMAALGGADMLACLNTIDDRADWDMIQAVVLDVRSQICTPFVAPEIPVTEPEVETETVEETVPVVEAEAPSTAEIVPVVVTVEEKEAPEDVSMEDGVPMDAPMDESAEEDTPGEAPEDESGDETMPEEAPVEEESAEEAIPEVAPEDESAEEAIPEEAEEEEPTEEAAAPAAEGSRRLLRSA